tara:strand:+ start:32 stop:535 length:504 start_codon:yes stop_codon:yes gene_type:complete
MGRRTLTTKQMENFNTNNSAKGIAYEKEVKKDLIERGYTDITEGIWPTKRDNNHPTRFYSKGVYFASVDFCALNPSGEYEYIEAKGGVTGRRNNQKKLNSGATRSDTVKKALFNGAIRKKILPQGRYVIYFSEEPRPNSPTDVMIDQALEWGWVDEVRYLPFYETIN